MNISFKNGVLDTNLKSIMFRAIFICAKVYNGKNFDLVITSTDEGNHMEGSLHYQGLAIDIRTRRIPLVIIQNLYNEIKLSLEKISEYFQVTLETNHIHIEYDRR